MSEMADFLSNIPTDFTNEADVERRLIVPLLHALGYESDDIASKYPVEFREGRVGRKSEADFVFNGRLHNRDTSLVVVEAKAPARPYQTASYKGNLTRPV